MGARSDDDLSWIVLCKLDDRFFAQADISWISCQLLFDAKGRIGRYEPPVTRMTLPDRSEMSLSGMNEFDTPKPNMIDYFREICGSFEDNVDAETLQDQATRRLYNIVETPLFQ